MQTYVFHVSLPGYGRVWRKIEMPPDQTLEDLHFAIQHAFNFDADHLYSFFMSGKAWDRSSEYCLPEGALDDLMGSPFGDEDEEEDEAAEEEEDMLAEPTSDELREMLALLEANPDLRAEMVRVVSEQTGMPQFMVNMFLAQGDQFLDLLEEDGKVAGDVRVTTLAALNLKLRKTFLYLFDYGDEWRFKVQLVKINQQADAGAQYPRVVESVGDPPPQYPDWEDDEEWDDEDEEDDEEM